MTEENIVEITEFEIDNLRCGVTRGAENYTNRAFRILVPRIGRHLDAKQVVDYVFQIDVPLDKLACRYGRLQSLVGQASCHGSRENIKLRTNYTHDNVRVISVIGNNEE